MRRRRELEARLREAERLLDRIDRNVEGIERITMVREPATGQAAEAYAGLRRQIGAALAERNAHLHQLAQFDAARRAGATPEQLESLVREWLGESRLTVIDDPATPGGFEEVGDPRGDHLRVLTPAYVDALTGRVVRGGVVERSKQPPQPAEPAEPVEPAEPTGLVEAANPGSPDDEAATATAHHDPNGASA